MSAGRSAFCPACGRHVLRARIVETLEQTCKGCRARLSITITAAMVAIAAHPVRENAGLAAKV